MHESILHVHTQALEPTNNKWRRCVQTTAAYWHWTANINGSKTFSSDVYDGRRKKFEASGLIHAVGGSSPLHNGSFPEQDAVGDGRLRSQCCHLANWTKHKHHLWFWSIRSTIWKRHVIQQTGSTQRIALLSQESCTKTVCDIWCAVFVICKQTDRQTNRHTNKADRHADTTHPYWGEVMMKKTSKNWVTEVQL